MKKPRCSFCQIEESKDVFLIEGKLKNGAYICKNCVIIIDKMIKGERNGEV